MFSTQGSEVTSSQFEMNLCNRPFIGMTTSTIGSISVPSDFGGIVRSDLKGPWGVLSTRSKGPKEVVGESLSG